MLDRGPPGGGGASQRVLVAEKRGPVVAAEGLEVADRGVELGAGIGAEGECRPVVRERLGVCVERSCGIAGRPVGGARRLVEPCLDEMMGDDGVSRACGQPDGENLGHPAMEEPPPGEAHLRLYERPGLLVPEVVGPGVALDEQAALGELVQSTDGFVVAAAARVPDRLGVEGPPDHRCGGDDLRRELAE